MLAADKLKENPLLSGRIYFITQDEPIPVWDMINAILKAAGLIKAVVPVFWKDEFVGAMGSCGFLQDDEEVDTFLINKIIGIDEDEIIALSNDIPRVSLKQAQRLKELSEN